MPTPRGGKVTSERRDTLHVLVVNSTFPSGGAERVTLDVVTGLPRDRFTVFACALYAPGAVGMTLAARGVRMYSGLMSSRWDPRAMHRLRRILRDQRIDVIYLMAQPVTLLWVCPLARLLGIPVIALVSNRLELGTTIQDGIYRRFLPWSFSVLGVSELQVRHIEQQMPTLVGATRVIHNGVDPSRFDATKDRDSLRLRYGMRPNAKVVGLAGRLVPLKAVDLFLGAAARIVRRLTDVDFAVVGDGPELPRLRQIARDLGIAERVTFTGFLEDPAEAIQCFDIGVLSSRTEALPMVILEYMAAGLPCVATDVGGVREMVADGTTGYVVGVDSTDKLETGICRLLEAPAAAAEMGRAARSRVAERFTLDKMVERTASLLCEASLSAR